MHIHIYLLHYYDEYIYILRCRQNKPKRIIFPIFVYVLFDRVQNPFWPINIKMIEIDLFWLFSRDKPKSLNVVGRKSTHVVTYTHTITHQPASHKKIFRNFPRSRNLSHCMCVYKYGVDIINVYILPILHYISYINSIFIHIQFCMIPLWSCSTNVHEIVTLLTVH